MGRILVRGVVGSVLTFKKDLFSEGNPKAKDPRTLAASPSLSEPQTRGWMGCCSRGWETVQVPRGQPWTVAPGPLAPSAVQLSLASHCA